MRKPAVFNNVSLDWTMFHGLQKKPSLALRAMRRFTNGNVFLSYGLAR